MEGLKRKEGWALERGLGEVLPKKIQICISVSTENTEIK